MAIGLADITALLAFHVLARSLLFNGHEHQRQRAELAPVCGVEERDEDHGGVFDEGFCRFTPKSRINGRTRKMV